VLLMGPHAIAGACWIKRSDRLSRKAAVLATIAGLSFSGLPLAMKIRMRREPGTSVEPADQQRLVRHD